MYDDSELVVRTQAAPNLYCRPTGQTCRKKKAGTRNQGSSHPAPATVDAWQDNFVEVLNAVGDTFEA